MNWVIKITSKVLMTKISHISWGGYDKGFYGNKNNISENFEFLKFIILVLYYK